MKVDPILSEQLRNDFLSWRAAKRYGHEKIPPKLLAKARDFAGQFGPAEAIKATGLTGTYFKDDQIKARRQKKPKEISVEKQRPTVGTPTSYTKVEVPVPFAHGQVEFETPLGFKMRFNGLPLSPSDLMHLFFEGGAK